jgi:hypothetical protein
MSRIIKPDGIIMCFGWNSSGVGIKRGMKLVEILMVSHGGSHNDTIVTVEKKVENLQGNLFARQDAEPNEAINCV